MDSSWELFCRALNDADSNAWTEILIRYQRMFAKWVRTTAPSLPLEEVDDVLQTALIKILVRFSPSQPHARAIEQDFAGLQPFLAFLKRVVHNETCNYLTRKREEPWDPHVLPMLPRIETEARSEATGEKLLRAETLRFIQAWMVAIKDPQERRFLELRYSHDLTPTEIAMLYPAEFSHVNEVHKINERLNKRLTHALSDFWGIKVQKRVGRKKAASQKPREVVHL